MEGGACLPDACIPRETGGGLCNLGLEGEMGEKKLPGAGEGRNGQVKGSQIHGTRES